MGFARLDPAPASVAASGDASLAAAADGSYTWPSSDTPPRNRMMHKVFIQNAPDSNSTIFIKWNDSTVSTTEWDAVLVPGDHLSSPDELEVDQVQVLATVATATYLTEFQVRGWVSSGSVQ